MRQLQRLYASYREYGASGLASKRRGKPSNYQLPALLKYEAINLIGSKYRDFGPTLAMEKLAEVHNIHLAKETVRKLMIEAELWIPRSLRLKRAHQPRYRRDCYGELIQIGGSRAPLV